MSSASGAEYDLFISYAHADNGNGWLTALVEAIKAEHAKFSSAPLRVFFDQTEIQSMNDWEHRILLALRESKIMLAALSPAYFQSEYCRKEWEIYIDHELGQAMPGEAIAPVYIVTYEAFEDRADEALNEWMRNLKRRQYVDVRNWWEEGPRALERHDVRQRLELMDQQIGERLDRLARVHASPTTIPDHNPHFVGRIDELRKLRETLALGRVGAITTLHGIGGIGKSALAFEYAHAYADDYPDGRYLIGCEGDTDLRISLLKLVPQLGIELTEAEQRDLEAAAARVKTTLCSRRRMLLVLDNVDDPRLLAQRQCARYLPDGAKVHVLATTRMGPDCLPGTECIALDWLAETDALRLLEYHRPFSISAGDDEWKAGLRIVRRLGGHSLAVEVVAVYLWQNPDVSYQGYLERLECEGLEAIEGAGGDELVQLSRHTEKLVGNLLEPTLSALSAEELSALEVASLLPPDNIAMPWLQQLACQEFPELGRAPRPGHPDPWRRIVRRLTGLRLLTPSDSGTTCRMHRLVQDVVTRRMEERRPKRVRQIQLYVRERGKFLWEGWVDHQARWELSPLVDYAHLLLNGKQNFGAWLASRLSRPLEKLGRFLEARTLLRQAVAVRESDSGSGRRDLATSYANLAMSERALGDFASARELLQRALTIWEEVYSSDDPILASGYSNLSTVERALGDYESARDFAQRAISIWESAVKPDQKALATGYSNLARVEGQLANLETARDLHQKAIGINEKLFKSEHPTLASSYSDLAAVERSLGNLAAARDLYVRAIAIKEKIYESGHPTLANSYTGLAAVERDLANYASAQKLWKQIIIIREKAYESDHSLLAASYAGLATLERDLAHFATARELHEQALMIRMDAFDAEHPNVAASYAKLAAIEHDLAHYASAREFYTRSIEIYRRVLDENHPTLASTLSGLASLEKTLANFSACRELLQRVLSMRLKTYQPDHPALAGSYAELAAFEQDMANYPAARNLYERSLAIRRQVFDPSHPTLASSFAGLASLERELGNLSAALDLTQQALAIRKRVFEPDHPTLANSYSSLAAVEWERGNRVEARELHRQALAIREKVYASDHPILAASYSALGSAERGLGNFSAAQDLQQRALVIREKVFASDHPSIASSCVGLASLERAYGNSAKARELLTAAKAIDEGAYGADHPLVARDCNALAPLLAELGQLPEAIPLMRRAWTIRATRYGLQDKRTSSSQSWLIEHDPEFDATAIRQQ